MNVAILTKWLWCLKSDYNSVWASCITYLHNMSGIYGKPLAKCRIPGTQFTIANNGLELENWNISLDNMFERKVRVGDRTHF